MAIPTKIRSDRGTETVDIYAVHNAFHEISPQGVVDCWSYGRSVYNQKIECFWSQLVHQWVARWQEVFSELEWSGLWVWADPVDEACLLYVYMPIIREELNTYRRDYNAYPMRRNNVSHLPSGPPEDSYLLAGALDLSIPIDPGWVDEVREACLGDDFDSDRYLDDATFTRLDTFMDRSPFGAIVEVGNAREQYLYLRDCLQQAGHGLL